MAIVIPHRFIDRLLPDESISQIDYLFIGTFNPGEPVVDKLTKEEFEWFTRIKLSTKYQRFSAVMNFYDRPPNRFWGILDRLDKQSLYEKHGIGYKNKQGLKYYTGCDRAAVFKRQQQFCAKNRVFITDIIREINPPHLDRVYKNFEDSYLDKHVLVWNTDFVKTLILQYEPKKVFFNFGQGKSISNISMQRDVLKEQITNGFECLLSSSGAAAKTYPQLVQNWSEFISFQKTSE